MISRAQACIRDWVVVTSELCGLDGLGFSILKLASGHTLGLCMCVFTCVRICVLLLSVKSRSTSFIFVWQCFPIFIQHNAPQGGPLITDGWYLSMVMLMAYYLKNSSR